MEKSCRYIIGDDDCAVRVVRVGKQMKNNNMDVDSMRYECETIKTAK